VDLDERLSALGEELARREVTHADSLAAARTRATELHARVEGAIGAYHSKALPDAPWLEVSLSAPKTDDKHLHSVEFDVRRGRHRALVTVKSRGDVTLVGPFHMGKAEGPCKTFAMDDDASIDAALGEVLAEFIEQAATP
jgi:hypothetical protein